MREARLTILHGSQTGTATDVAKRIRKQAKLRHFTTVFLALNDFTLENLATTNLIVFVVSTTGQGEEPDNMKIFWRTLLRRRLPPDALKHVDFAVLGLGDSSYQLFNFTAKRLNKRLVRLGATAFHPLGLADDQHELGFDGVADPWVSSLFDKLLEKFPLPDGVDLLSQQGPPESTYSIELVDRVEDAAPEISQDIVGVDPVFDADRPFLVSVLLNERATAEDHFQDVRFIRFDISGGALAYEPGDIMMVYPKNQPDRVNELLELLGMDGDKCLRIFLNDEDAKLPASWRLTNPCTTLQAAINLWDFQGVPRRSFFELLSQFAADGREKERLNEFASPEGIDELFAYCFRPRRTAFEVLQDFPETRANVPFEYWFDLFPPLQARAFSIASSPIHHPGELHILVAVVTYKTKLKKPRAGLCSNFLKFLVPGDNLHIWVKKGSIPFDKVEDRPIVMVGPGTGVAPFRSYIFNRAAQEVPGSVLAFGCRNRGKDYYFGEEWRTLQEEGLLTLLPPAFSRDQPEKIYVQDILRKASHVIFEAVYEQEGFFCIAGNAKNMPNDVLFALKRILCENSKMEMDQADTYIKEMQKEGRYLTETWS